MGFFDSVKNVVKEASEEAREKIKSKEKRKSKTERKQEASSIAEKRKQYLEALAPFYYAFDSGSGISIEFEKKILESLGFTDIDEKALSQLGYHQFPEGVECRDYVFRRKEPKTKVEPSFLLDLIQPGISQEILTGIAPALYEACQYKDYTIDGQIVGLLAPLTNKRVEDCKREFMDGKLGAEIEKRVLRNDVKLCQEILEETTSPLSNIFVNLDTDYEQKTIILLGAACRICNFASYNGEGAYTPISNEKWREIVKGTWKSKLEGLSPEGCESVINKYFSIIIKKDISKTSFGYLSDAMKNETVYDGIMYHSYIRYLLGNNYDKKNKCLNIAEVYEVLLDCLVSSV